jgi:hypothetical protein
MSKRERDSKQGWAKHKRNLDGGSRLIQKRLRRKAKAEIKAAQN